MSDGLIIQIEEVVDSSNGGGEAIHIRGKKKRLLP